MTATPTAGPPDPSPVLAGRIPALDGLRGVAILAVLAHQLSLDSPPASRALAAFMAPFEAGWTGVQLFFVLSGFLITGILLDTKGAENYWSAFLMRRALRIFPPYYLLLFLTFVIVPALFPLPQALLDEHRHQIWFWLYLDNWRFVQGGGVTGLGHCWSLAVEEQFYLVWPAVVGRTTDRGLLQICGLLTIGALVLRIGIVAARINPDVDYYCTLTRADPLALGAAVAVLVRRRDWLAAVAPRLARVTWVALGSLAITALASGGLSRSNVVTLTVGHSVVAVTAALVILGIVLDMARGGSRLVSALAWRPLRAYGKHSYAIYLFHFPLHLIAAPTLAARAAGLRPSGFLMLQAGYFIAATAALLGLGIVFHAAFERPILELKRFFLPRRPLPLA